MSSFIAMSNHTQTFLRTEKNVQNNPKNKPCNINFLNGGKAFIPDDYMDEFLQNIALDACELEQYREDNPEEFEDDIEDLNSTASNGYPTKTNGKKNKTRKRNLNVNVYCNTSSEQEKTKQYCKVFIDLDGKFGLKDRADIERIALFFYHLMMSFMEPEQSQEMIVCTRQLLKNSFGIHIIWPRLFWDSYTVMLFRENALMFMRKLRDRGITPFTDEKIPCPSLLKQMTDEQLYDFIDAGPSKNKTLRMLFSRKVMKCPKCKDNSIDSKTCIECVGSGKVIADQYYKPFLHYKKRNDERISFPLEKNWTDVADVLYYLKKCSIFGNGLDTYEEYLDWFNRNRIFNEYFNINLDEKQLKKNCRRYSDTITTLEDGTTVLTEVMESLNLYLNQDLARAFENYVLEHYWTDLDNKMERREGKIISLQKSYVFDKLKKKYKLHKIYIKTNVLYCPNKGDVHKSTGNIQTFIVTVSIKKNCADKWYIRRFCFAKDQEDLSDYKSKKNCSMWNNEQYHKSVQIEDQELVELLSPHIIYHFECADFGSSSSQTLVGNKRPRIEDISVSDDVQEQCVQKVSNDLSDVLGYFDKQQKTKKKKLN